MSALLSKICLQIHSQGAKMSEQKRQNEAKYPYFCALQRYLKIALINEPKNLTKYLGYASENRCRTAVERFTSCNNPCEWLCKGYFDFTHTSFSFLQRCERLIGDKDFLDKIELGIKSQNTFLRQDKKRLLDEVELGTAQKAFQDEIEKAKVEAQRLSDLRSCFVRIQTDFRRVTQPIHILTLARRMLYFELPIKDEWIEKGLECALQELPQILREHYEKKKGRLSYPYESNIVGYSVLWKNGDKQEMIHFDTQGKRVEESSEKDTHPRASISV